MKQIAVLEDEDERELEVAGQSILPNMVEQEVNICEKFSIYFPSLFFRNQFEPELESKQKKNIKIR